MKRKFDNQKASHVRDEPWQLQEAKACFSEVVRRAKERPQIVTVHGKPSAVVVSSAHFERMLPESGQGLAELMSCGPLGEVDFGHRGEAMPVREVDL